MIVERLLAWRALLEQIKQDPDNLLTLDVWFDDQTGAMDPLTWASSHPEFQRYGLRYLSKDEIPYFYDLVGFDACSAFFGLTMSQVMFILDPDHYDEVSFDKVLEHLESIINQYNQKQEKQ